jgi:hypothetical protein
MSASIIFASTFVLAQAQAANATVTSGVACLINAPSGALTVGHVGWAFKSANSDQWTFGATEGNGQLYQAPGSDTHSWSNVGTQWGMFNQFESGLVKNGATYFSRGYYTQFRCRNVTNANETLAKSVAASTATSGYYIANNNCLTKAVAILNAYGANMPGWVNARFPNDYFNSLPSPWGATQPVPTLLQLWAALNDPLNGTPINTHPLHTQRPMYITIYNSANTLVRSITSTATRKTGTSEYWTNVNVGNLPSGYYQVKIRLDYTLVKLVAGISTIVGSQPNIFGVVPLTVGDVNQDNQVNITDYNLMMQCYSDIAPPKGPCSPALKRASDLNDDGYVNQIDYNLYLRVVQSLSGG